MENTFSSNPFKKRKESAIIGEKPPIILTALLRDEIKFSPQEAQKLLSKLEADIDKNPNFSFLILDFRQMEYFIPEYAVALLLHGLYVKLGKRDFENKVNLVNANTFVNATLQSIVDDLPNCKLYSYKIQTLVSILVYLICAFFLIGGCWWGIKVLSFVLHNSN